MLLHPDRWNPTSIVKKWLIVIHDSESPDNSTSGLLAEMARPGDRPNGDGTFYGSGYHAITDGKGGYVTIADGAMGPFACPPRNGDAWHICMPGYASQAAKGPGDSWDDTLSDAHIQGVAQFVVDKAMSDGIPMTLLSINDLRALSHGYTSHNNCSQAWHQSTHTDPGPNFPWATLAAKIEAIRHPFIPKPVPTPNPTPVDPPTPITEDDDMPTTLHVRAADGSRPEAVVIIDGAGRQTISAKDYGPGSWTNVLTATKAAPCDVDNGAQFDAITGVKYVA